MELHSLVSQLKELKNKLGEIPTREVFLKECKVTDWQLRKHTFKKLLELASIKEEPEEKIQLIRPPRILYFDIESVGLEVKTYQLKNDYISPKNVLKDWSLLSYAGAFEGEPEKFFYLDQRFAQDKREDRQLTEGLHDLLQNADILVGHNIDRFDLKKFNTKAAKYNLEPLRKIITYDTLKMARKYFAVTSNSLWYLANFFNLENRKSEHGKFAGDKLWDECMAGNLEAWIENEHYNKMDVSVTRELFKYIVKYDSRINFQSFFQKPTCSCGSHDFYKDEINYAKNGAFQSYRCIDCGKSYEAKENLIDKDLRKGFFR